MKFKIVQLVFLLQFFKFGDSIDCNANSNNVETRLKKFLLCGNYDPNVRPVKNHNTTVVIRTKLIIKGFEFDDDKNMLTLSAWMVKRWNDDFLRWDPREYEKISSIDESPNSIWTPHIAMYNSDISYDMGSCHETNCLIYSNGEANVACVDPCTFVGHCNADYTRWPFDTQNCTLFFGAWLAMSNEIDFNANKTSIESKGVAVNSQWKLISTQVRKIDTTYIKNGVSLKSPSLKYNIVIERHSSSRSVMIVVPALVMILINLFSFYINVSSWERTGMIAINLFCHFNSLLLLTWMVPYNADSVATVYLFFRDSILITGFILVETLILRNMLSLEVIIPNWAEIVVLKVTNIRITDVVFKKFVNKTDAEQGSVDTTIINEGSQKSSKQNQMWQLIVKILDILTFAAILLTYLIMLIIMLPSSYLLNIGDILNFEK